MYVNWLKNIKNSQFFPKPLLGFENIDLCKFYEKSIFQQPEILNYFLDHIITFKQQEK